MASAGTNCEDISITQTDRPDLYKISYHDEEKTARLPKMFSKKHFTSVPTYVIFTDPVGNELNLTVKKEDQETYFTDGWNYVGHFYGIEAGGSLHLHYVSWGHFTIRVFNQWGDQVTYPPIPESLEKGDSSHPILLDQENVVVEDEHFPHIVDRSKCITTFKKWLSFDEIMGNKLCFDKTWSSYYLPKSDGKLSIVDEYGNCWACYFHANIADTNKSGIVKGWSTFVVIRSCFRIKGSSLECCELTPMLFTSHHHAKDGVTICLSGYLYVIYVSDAPCCLLSKENV